MEVAKHPARGCNGFSIAASRIIEGFAKASAWVHFFSGIYDSVVDCVGKLFGIDNHLVAHRLKEHSHVYWNHTANRSCSLAYRSTADLGLQRWLGMRMT